jgi:hypothetical protein
MPQLEQFSPVGVSHERCMEMLRNMAKPNLKLLHRMLVSENVKVSMHWINKQSSEHKWVQIIKHERFTREALMSGNEVPMLKAEGLEFNVEMLQGLKAHTVKRLVNQVDSFECKEAKDFTVLMGFLNDLQRLIHSERGIAIAAEGGDPNVKQGTSEPQHGMATVTNLGDFKPSGRK